MAEVSSLEMHNDSKLDTMNKTRNAGEGQP